MRLLRPRWWALHFVVLAVVVACVALGFWQLRRLAERRSANAQLTERLEQPVEPLEELLAATDDIAHRRVSVVGRYDPAREVLWQRGSSYEGEPGYQLLTPLVLEDGRALLVDRGWAPFSYREPPVLEAAPPTGEVALVGTLSRGSAPPEGFWANLAPRNPPGELEITVYANPVRLQDQLSYEVLPLVLELREQRPPQTGALPVVLPLEPLSDGPHLGYAIQWFTFALVGVVGYFFLLRRLAEPQP